MLKGKEGSSTVAVGYGGLHGGHEGSSLGNLEDNVHDGCVVFIISWVVVGGPLDLFVVEGQVLGSVGQRQRGDGHVSPDNVGKEHLVYSKDWAEVVSEELDHLHDGYGPTQGQ